MHWLYGPPVFRRLQFGAVIALLAMIAVSLLNPVTWSGRVHNGGQLTVELRSATLAVARLRPGASGAVPKATGWSAAGTPPSPQWLPLAWTGPGGKFGLELPLWLPLALILLASLAARAILRRSQPGHCTHCGYDLRPLPSTPSVVCPECGRKNLRRPAAADTSPT